MIESDKNLKIFIAGHSGMVGSSCYRNLTKKGFKNIYFKTSKELDLRCQKSVNDYLSFLKPDIIVNAAAKVGGILENNNMPYQFLMDNLLIQNNLIKSAHENEVKKFIFLGSSCIYPKLAPQPIKEEYLLTDSLEPTNQWYAIAKISGVKLIESLRNQYNRDYVSLMPTNLYGPNDNYNLNSSHVLPALIRKFHEAKINKQPVVTLWGSGNVFREFLHVDDLAEAIFYFIINKSAHSLYNVGYGVDISIKDLAEKISGIIGYNAEIVWDNSKPDGTPKKLIDSEKMKKLGWSPKINLDEGINLTYGDFKNNYSRYTK